MPKDPELKARALPALAAITDEEEARIYAVTDITQEAVVVDANHPLAGERLWFKCAVKDVRAATGEELKHGHVHGDLGVHPQ